MVVVNADDFGLTHEANQGIVECFKRGLIQRTTLVTNSPYTEEAVTLAWENHFEDAVGLHFNLTEGEPLVRELRHDSLLCHPDGTFSKKFRLSYASRFLYLSRSTRELIAAEFEAQGKAYRDYGFRLGHLDSHHHIHTDLQIYLSIRCCIRACGFKSIRICPNTYPGMPEGVRAYYKRFFCWIVQHDDLAVQPFAYLDMFRRMQSPPEDLEIMAHPVMKNGLLVDLLDKDFPSGLQGR